MNVKGFEVNFLGDSITFGVGVSDIPNCRYDNRIAKLLGLSDVHAFAPEGEVPCGRIGKLPVAVDLAEFSRTVCALLDAPAVNVIGKGTVQTVAVIGGEGGDFVDAARREGADVILSGRIGYHRMLDAAEDSICAIEAGHFYTERPVLAHLAALRALSGRICGFSGPEPGLLGLY